MEVLAVRWLFPDREVTVQSRCLDCGEPIRIRTCNDNVLEVDPETMVGYQPSPFARSRSGSAAFN